MPKPDELKRWLAFIAEHGWTVRRVSKAGIVQVVCGCGQHGPAHFHPTPSSSRTWENLARRCVAECPGR
jgi:hypothetical protein